MSNAILLVEDDSNIRQFVELVLNRAGYTVVSAANGIAALALLDRGTPGLVLLDMHLPQMNGHTFLCTFLTMPQRPPVIVVTVDPLSISYEDEASIDGVLLKPFTVDELMDCVHTYVPLN